MTTKILIPDDNLSKKEIRRSILAFSWPIMAELMLMSLLSMVSLAMVGHLGAYAISSVGITSLPVMISVAVFQSLNIGATALVSRFIGAREYTDAKKVVIQTMILSVLSGVVLTIPGFIFAKQIVLWLGAKPDTLEPSTMFMKYMAIGMFFQSIPTAVTSIFRGAGESKIPMRYNIISNIINAAVGFVLIYGFWHFPGLGLEGAAIAATLAKVVVCGMSLVALARTQLPVAISVQDNFKFDLAVIKRIMNIGLSAAGEQLANTLGFLLYSKIVADLGTVAFASHQICMSVTQYVFNAVSGLSVAASSFTGQCLGAKKPDLAQNYCHQINKIGLIISISISFFYFVAGYQFSQIYTSDVPVLISAASILKIAAFITLPQNYLMIVSGCLRGAGDTRWPLVTALIGTILIRVSLAAIFVKAFDWGLAGAWSAALIDKSIGSIIIYYRFKTGNWKKIEV